MAWLTLIISIANSFFNAISNFFSWQQHNQIKEDGKNEEELKLLRKENEDLRKQNEILNSERTKVDVENKLEKGEF